MYVDKIFHNVFRKYLFPGYKSQCLLLSCFVLGAIVLIKRRDYHIGPGIKDHLLGESANLRTGTSFIQPIKVTPITSEIVLWNDGC